MEEVNSVGMSTTTSATVRPRVRKSARFLAGVVAGVIAFGGVGAATANPLTLGNVTNARAVITYHQVPRYNSFAQNLVAWKPTYHSCNYYMILAIRDTYGQQQQVARNETSSYSMGTWKTLKKSNGSSQIPRGHFYLTSKMDNYSAGSPQPANCTWNAELMWNVNNP